MTIETTTVNSTENSSRREIGTVAVRPDAELYIELSAVLQRIAKGNSPLPFLLQFTFQPIGAAAAKEGEKHGGNVLNLLSNNMACK